MLAAVDAEEKQASDPAVRKWLDDLKQCLNQTEEIANEITTKALKLGLPSQPGPSGSGSSSFQDATMMKIKRVNRMLQTMLNQKNDMGLGHEHKWDQCQEHVRSIKDLVGRVRECFDCLAYCSLFPKEYELEGDTLIQLWMAAGLIQEEPMEDIATAYLRAFTQRDDIISSSRVNYGAGKRWYKVMKFRHSKRLQGISRLRLVTMDDCDIDPSTISKTDSPCHVNVQGSPTNYTLQVLGRCPQIRAVLLLQGHMSNIDCLPYDFFISLEFLQALDLSGTKLLELPSSIGDASPDEAKEANLSHKQRLTNLELRWTAEDDAEEEAIEHLQPHTNLQDLRIICYGGSKFPSWISNQCFDALVRITLFRCENCRVLPSLGQLPGLEVLSLIELLGVKIIDFHFGRDASSIEGENFVAFPNLQKLTIKSMVSLKEWRDMGEDDFPRLTNLRIKDCPELVGLCRLSNFHTLQRLEINSCSNLWDFPGDLPASIKKVVIGKCPLLSIRCLEQDEKGWQKTEGSPAVMMYQRDED
ncbi:hypothetical protein Cgig2_001392 [Carnegiea gigantea]|uniref:Rx N-terminal domain-containing protein n=1 Tax=Carnegiea gigantea TaxID=171969 RepID=A0A9Q1KVT8_9CARY|nr:hypothetical protein Cgig2_001392 [Carnegiea gigantea]